jgi:hypothetical protein
VLPSAILSLHRPPLPGKIRKITLNTAVVLFGFGLNIRQVIVVGGQGFWQTAVSLLIIISLGFSLLRFFRLETNDTETDNLRYLYLWWKRNCCSFLGDESQG